MQLWRGLKKPAPKQALLLPSHWVVDGKNSNILQLSDDGLIINAQPQDSRMVWSLQPELPSCQPSCLKTALANGSFPVEYQNVICYFEITLQELPRDRYQMRRYLSINIFFFSIIAIGIAENTFPSSKCQPGWLEKYLQSPAM